MKSLTDILAFLEDVLGKPSAQVFDENIDEYIYFVRFAAINDLTLTDSKMRSRLRKLAEGIIAASIRRFLNENYADDFGDVELNINDNGVYDRNMQPISAIEKIRKSQREMIGSMVSLGMYEFAKGRQLAKIMDARSQNDRSKEPNPKDVNWKPAKKTTTLLEMTEVTIMRLERKLPDLTKEEAKTLSLLYSRLKTCRQAK